MESVYLINCLHSSVLYHGGGREDKFRLCLRETLRPVEVRETEPHQQEQMGGLVNVPREQGQPSPPVTSQGPTKIQVRQGVRRIHLPSYHGDVSYSCLCCSCSLSPSGTIDLGLRC